MSVFLGLDVGTSGLRALLIEENGIVIGEATKSYNVAHPAIGWCEQSAEFWIDACEYVFEELRQSHELQLSRLRGIGVSGHMHGAVCVDADGKPLRPCILWNDVRASKQASYLDNNSQFRKISGNVVFPGFTAPKILWIAENEPGIFERTRKVILPKDFIVHWLTGKYSSEMSDAAGTSWLDMCQRRWSDDLLGATRLCQNDVPPLYEGCEVVGSVRCDLAGKLGIPLVTKVVAGAADNAAAACGLGVLSDGQAFVSLGTSGVIVAGRNTYAPAPETAVHTFCHAVPNKWYQMGVMLSATGSLDWLSRMLDSDVATLSKLVPSEASGPGTVQFLPYLNGERTPHNDARALGTFMGLSASTSRGDLVRAVMEGVSFGLRDCLESIRSTGAKVSEVIATGGGCKSEFWLDTLAQALGVTVRVPEKGEFGAALGAARLAIVGVNGEGGDIESFVDRVMKAPPIARSFDVRREIAALYETAYRRYAASYKVVAELAGE